ncbi:hypothetical protein BDV96DRAFT_606884 [Lophiotrema nucula]|uniref:RING-type domain-containing protein n=1 Tax=Lophiotrema nucula TaxID=690887 RepID=A0A6A5YLP4_9PLEO|nr:hypothetical protein BDV96DRAFT_606884 [Lophiotrema nucula]
MSGPNNHVLPSLEMFLTESVDIVKAPGPSTLGTSTAHCNACNDSLFPTLAEGQRHSPVVRILGCEHAFHLECLLATYTIAAWQARCCPACYQQHDSDTIAELFQLPTTESVLRLQMLASVGVVGLEEILEPIVSANRSMEEVDFILTAIDMEIWAKIQQGHRDGLEAATRRYLLEDALREMRDYEMLTGEVHPKVQELSDSFRDFKGGETQHLENVGDLSQLMGEMNVESMDNYDMLR